MTCIGNVKLVVVDDSYESCGANVGHMRIASIKGHCGELSPLCVDAVERFGDRLLNVALSLCVLQPLFQVYVHLLTAKVGQLPPLIAVKYARIVAFKRSCELLSTQPVIDGRVGWPLDHLDSVPELVPDHFFLFFFLFLSIAVTMSHVSKFLTNC